MAMEAALVFPPEVIEMHARTERYQGCWCDTLIISASEALLKDAQDLYAKEGFTECSTRDAFYRPSGSLRFFLDAGKLHVRDLRGFFAHPQYHNLLLRPCLAALAARGLAPAPAEPAALAACAAGLQAPTEEDLYELWCRAEQPGGLRSLWLPRAPPARPAGGTPAGMAVLRLLKDGAVSDFEAPENVCSEVKRRWPDVHRDMAAEFENNGTFKTYNAITLAVYVSASQSCGYKLVAPTKAAEQAVACCDHSREVLGAKLQPLAIDAKLLFLPKEVPLPQPGASTATTSMAVLRVQQDGFVMAFEAPEDLWAEVKQRWPEACRDVAAVFDKTGACKGDSAIVVAVLAASHHCGYELVAPKAAAERAMACRHDGSEDIIVELQLLAQDAEFVFLPKAVPQTMASTASTPVIHVRKDGAVTAFEAPEDLRVEVEARWPGDLRDMLAGINGKQRPWKACNATLLAMLVSASQHCGYELVAPKEVAEQALVHEQKVDPDIAAQLQLLALGAKLSFLPQAVATATGEMVLLISADSITADVQRIFTGLAVPPKCSHRVLLAWLVPALDSSGYELIAPKGLAQHANACSEQGADFSAWVEQLAGMDIKAPLVFVQRARLSAEQRCILDVQSVEEFCPPGHATIEVNANGMVSSFDGPREVKLIIEEAHPWVCNEVVSRLQGVSVEFAPRLVEVLTTSLTSLGYKQVTAPVESVAGAYRFFRPSKPAPQPQEASLVAEEALQAVREEFATKLQAQTDEQQAWQARLAAEQHSLRDEMHQALNERDALLAEVREALRAEFMQALREHQEDAAEKQRSGLEALEDVRSQVNVLVTARREHDEVVAALKAKLLAAEQGAAEAKDKPCFRIYDVDGGTAGAAKHIRIECAGAEVDDITIEDLCNGVHVHIAVSTNLPTEFDKEFVFDRRKDGFFELRQDECWYENGVLLLVLRGTLPKRMKLTQRASLATVVEEVQRSHSEGNAQTPMYYDIASVHLEGSQDADSLRSWMPVGVDARASAWPQSEQDAMSVSKESVGEASQQSSWAMPNGAASSQRGAPQALSSSGSGVASIATVHSVASAPARGTTPCCFLPGTAFRKAETGEYVRAADLKGAGGDRLLGPRGSEVLVRSAIRHAPVEQDFVSLRLRGVKGAFVVTADHRLLTRGPDSEPITCTAGDFARGYFSHLYNGTDFHEVEQADRYKDNCQVVELAFEGDAVALAWVLPRRPRSSEARIPVAVPGKVPTLGDHGLRERQTFLDCPNTALSASAGLRSRSAGAHPLPGSPWSVGSAGHDDCQPEKCDVCNFHQLYLKSLRGPNAARAVPCAEGAACSKCHAPHPEYRRPRQSA